MREERIPINQENTGQTVIIQSKRTNTAGVAGFIMALMAIFLSWIPLMGFIIWLLGLIFSLIGIFKRPRGFAIAGLVISLIGIVLIIILLATIMGIAVFTL